jgi:AraC-like DNA-binding protein
MNLKARNGVSRVGLLFMSACTHPIIRPIVRFVMSHANANEGVLPVVNNLRWQAIVNREKAYDRKANGFRTACRDIAKSGESLSLKALANTSGSSSSRFHNVFKAATGHTPKTYSVAEPGKRQNECVGRLWSPDIVSIVESEYQNGKL